MFKTTGILNESILREVKRYVLPPKQRMMIIVLPLILVVAACISYGFFQSQSAASISIVMALFLFFQMNKMSENAIKMNMHNMRANCGTDACSYTTSFSDEGILVHNHATGAKVRYKYQGIVKIVETESLYAIFTKAHQMICVFRRDLDENPQELMDYLKQQPTQIKWK